MAKKCTETYNARAHPILLLIKLFLFGGVLVPFFVVFCSSDDILSLIYRPCQTIESKSHRKLSLFWPMPYKIEPIRIQKSRCMLESDDISLNSLPIVRCADCVPHCPTVFLRCDFSMVYPSKALHTCMHTRVGLFKAR